MTDFRKWFVALAVLVAMVGVASAQQAFQCTANAGVPAKVRGEGRTELVGDMILSCSGVLTVTSVTANIQIFLSTNITSRILETSTYKTEALLTLGDPAYNLQTTSNVFLGTKAGDNSLLWTNIPVVTGVPVGSTATQTIRLTNVRANAVQAFSAGQTYIPQQITMFVTVTSSTAIPINNPTQVVAAVLKGLDFAARNCADDGGIGTSYAQCSSNNSDFYGDPTEDLDEIKGVLKFSEGFDAAFKVGAGNDPGTLGSYLANSESGFMNSAVFNSIFGAGYGAKIGTAVTGTRLIARFANVPAGVKVVVTTAKVANAASSGTVSAVLVSVTDPTGTGGTYTFPIPGTAQGACGSGTDKGDKDIVEVPLYGGAGAATWEITAASQSATETIAFGVAIAYSANPASNIPALTEGTPGTVSGNFAPISSDDKMSYVSTIPRFADLPITKDLIVVNACITNLLFPFVTARGGFDTGIAISNTTLDNSSGLSGGTSNYPYHSRATNGACTLYYFGDKEDGTSLAKAVQKSGTIAAGKQLVYTLFGGGSGIDATPGFQGYMIATCYFHLAHGFAFISDLGAQKLAMGYLSLVIPRNNHERREPAGNTSSDSGYAH